MIDYYVGEWPSPKNPASPEERHEMQRLYWDIQARAGTIKFTKSIPDLVATGKWQMTEVLWSGYAINTATLLGLGMWLWFTPIVIRDVWRWRRARRRARQGRCGACGYDRCGLAEGAVCPECGAAMSAPNEAHP